MTSDGGNMKNKLTILLTATMAIVLTGCSSFSFGAKKETEPAPVTQPAVEVEAEAVEQPTKNIGEFAVGSKITLLDVKDIAEAEGMVDAEGNILGAFEADGSLLQEVKCTEVGSYEGILHLQNGESSCTYNIAWTVIEGDKLVNMQQTVTSIVKVSEMIGGSGVPSFEPVPSETSAEIVADTLYHFQDCTLENVDELASRTNWALNVQVQPTELQDKAIAELALTDLPITVSLYETANTDIADVVDTEAMPYTAHLFCGTDGFMQYHVIWFPTITDAEDVENYFYDNIADEKVKEFSDAYAYIVNVEEQETITPSEDEEYVASANTSATIQVKVDPNSFRAKHENLYKWPESDIIYSRWLYSLTSANNINKCIIMPDGTIIKSGGNVYDDNTDYIDVNQLPDEEIQTIDEEPSYKLEGLSTTYILKPSDSPSLQIDTANSTEDKICILGGVTKYYAQIINQSTLNGYLKVNIYKNAARVPADSSEYTIVEKDTYERDGYSFTVYNIEYTDVENGSNQSRQYLVTVQADNSTEILCLTGKDMCGEFDETLVDIAKNCVEIATE